MKSMCKTLDLVQIENQMLTDPDCLIFVKVNNWAQVPEQRQAVSSCKKSMLFPKSMQN